MTSKEVWFISKEEGRRVTQRVKDSQQNFMQGTSDDDGGPVNSNANWSVSPVTLFNEFYRTAITDAL